MENINELKRFRKSFCLHASRYNLYSQETLVKGSIGKHNQAVTALGKLEAKVAENPSLYSDLLLELLQDDSPKVSLCAGFACLQANIHTEKAIEALVHIGNSSGISMICDFDIRGTITKFKKQQLEARPRNEVDMIAEKMKCPEQYMDAELWEMIVKLQDTDMGGYDERTVLIHACITNHFVLAKRLVESGADVNKKDWFEKTALHCAVIVGNIDIVSLLLSHHANVNMQERQGFTALDFAAFNAAKLSEDELDKMVRLLISYGAKNKKELLNA